ncbi:MAG: hypothetical protein IJT24_07890 [Lachnospiraceae bacterium]|nr:hypothetical protein [Lachnospiraceae bacterium]
MTRKSSEICSVTWGKSTEANVTDDTTRKLNDIVVSTKSKKDIGVRYMKSWEIARDYQGYIIR